LAGRIRALAGVASENLRVPTLRSRVGHVAAIIAAFAEALLPPAVIVKVAALLGPPPPGPVQLMTHGAGRVVDAGGL
jgi:hypothetical protein